MGMMFGNCRVRSMCWSGSLKIVARKLAAYRLYLVGVQEVLVLLVFLSMLFVISAMAG
jgi:hypothetical protein